LSVTPTNRLLQEARSLQLSVLIRRPNAQLSYQCREQEAKSNQAP